MNHLIRVSQEKNVERYINNTRRFLSGLVCEYPMHNEWFRGVASEMRSDLHKGREILLIVRDDEYIMGAAVLKKSNSEKKICCFRIAPIYQGQGLGTLLMKESFKILETEKPVITVSGQRAGQFKKILSYFQFSVERVYYEKYRPLTAEYCYNGILLPESIIKPTIHADDCTIA